MLGWVYWRTAPATFVAARRFDAIALLASLIAYKGFLLVLAAAWFWRRPTAPAAGRRSAP